MSDYKSTDLLNAIRNESSSEYQSRIPLATRDNLRETGSAIMEYSVTRNEFVNTLLNRIAKTIIKNMLFANPLKEFKKATMEKGHAIEEVFVDIVKAQVYDPTKSDVEVFKRNIPKLLTVFHQMNRQDKYKTTVSNAQLEKSFLTENGLSSLVDKIIKSLYTSDDVDEFLIMKNLFNIYGNEGKFHLEVITNPTDETTAKNAMVKVKEVSNNLTFPSTKYNYASVTNATPKENQVILINTRFDALVDVELLATAFNMSKAEFNSRKILVDDFGGLQNVVCAIVDKEWFMVWDNLFRSEEIYNPDGLYYNYWLHHWQTVSVSPFANAVLFVTVNPTLTAINLFPETESVAKGGTLQFTVEPVGTDNPPSKVIYTLTNAQSENTYITSTGLLILGYDETGETTGNTITVTATSTFDGSITDTATVTVV